MGGPNVAPLVPLALLWVGGAAAFFLDGRKAGVGWWAAAVTALALAASAVSMAAALIASPPDVVTGDWPPGVGIRLRPDVPGLIFTATSLLTLLCALVYETLHGVLTRTFPAVVLLLGAGLTGLFITGDLFNFYVFFEVSMIASFILAGYGEEPREMRAAAIFALVNLLGSALFLGAIAAMYRLTGTLDMAMMSDALSQGSEPRSMVAMLVLVAFALKLGIFPLHFWLPPVYRDTRPVVAAVLSAAVASIGSYGLIRFGLELFPREMEAGTPLLLAVGASSIVYGGVLAVSRRVSSEVLAYSAIGQVGYVLLALTVGGTAGVAAAIVYAVVNSLNKLVLFLAAGTVGPGVAAVFATGAFSVAGVPPTAGFAAKVELFRMAITNDGPGIATLVVLGSFLSVVYMFQAYQHNFWVPSEERPTSRLPVRVLLVALAVLLVAVGLWPESLIAPSRAAATILIQAGPQ
jgi:multicomponent Na+:H+ antiporter subunit D